MTLALIKIIWVIEQETFYRFLYLHYSSIKSRTNKYILRILIYPCILGHELLFEQPDYSRKLRYQLGFFRCTPFFRAPRVNAVLVQLFTVPVFVAVIAGRFNRSYDYKIFHARIHVRDLSRFIRSLPVMEVSIQGRVPLPAICTKPSTKGSSKGGNKVGISPLDFRRSNLRYSDFLLSNNISIRRRLKYNAIRNVEDYANAI